MANTTHDIAPAVKRRPVESLEKQLREELRGRQLVLEIGLTERRLRELRDAVTEVARTTSDPPARLCLRYPATYAAYLVAEGIYNYDGGAFWPNVITELRDPNLDAGYRFLRALKELGLPAFERLVDEDNATKYVSRILAHGGIPRNCATDFFRFLASEVRRFGGDASELLSRWRTQRTRLVMVHKPTARFLLYGGDPATDLLDRCLDLIERVGAGAASPAAHEVGLPEYLLEAFAALPPSERRTLRRTRRGLPRAAVQLDPYDGLGPTLFLPALSGSLSSATWRVHDGETTREVAASTLTDTSVRLSPATAWEAEFETNDGDKRKHTFEGLDRLPALFLDPAMGRAVRDPTVLPLDSAWVLRPQAWEVSIEDAEGARSQARVIEDLPSPAGSWDGFVLQHMDLEGARRVWLEELGGGGTRSVAVVPASARPRLVGERVDGVTTANGDAVFSSPPRIEVPTGSELAAEQWQIRLRGRGVDDTFTDPAGVEAGAVELAGRISGQDAGIYSLRVRGPLGSDLRETFAVVPGIRVRRPPGIVLPSHDAPEVSLSAAVHLQVGDEPAATNLVADLPPSADSVACRALATGERQVDLRVRVPRLLWTVTHDTKPAIAPADQVLKVGAEEFEDELADMLTVRAGQPGMPLQLLLKCGREIVKQSGECETAGADGRWSFDLGPFAETIRSSEAPLLAFHLRVGVHDIHVADIVAKVNVRGLRADARVADDFTAVRLSFIQERNVGGRISRLWSLERPWESPVSSTIPDGACEVEIAGYDTVPPGRYIAEIAIDDPWLTPRRPGPGAPNTACIRVGHPLEATARRSRLDSEPLKLLERAAAGDPIDDATDPAVLAPVAREAAITLDALLEQIPPSQPGHGGFLTVRALLCGEPELFLRGLVEAVATGDVDSERVPRIALRTLGRVRRSGEVVDDGELLAETWQASPCLAACFDVPAADVDPDAASRCEQHLGWRPSPEVPDPAGGKVTQNEAGRSGEELSSMRHFLGLVPQRHLDPETLQMANFEWLVAEKEASGSAEVDEYDGRPSSWYYRYRALADVEPTLGTTFATDALQAHADARRPPRGTFEWAHLAEVVLAAAAHFVGRSEQSKTARPALEMALGFAPRLVMHDILLALALELAPQPPQEPC